MNPVPRILIAEPGISMPSVLMLEKVSEVLNLLDAALDFDELARRDWFIHGTSTDDPIVISANPEPLRHLVTLYRQLQ